MKGYFLFAPVEPSCVGPNSGIERKVRAQYKALQQYVDCELVIFPAVQYSGSAVEKLIRRLPLTAAWRKWHYAGEFDDADFLYIRQVYHDASFVRYLKAIRRSNPRVNIVYELPTFPYDGEVRLSLANASFIAKERIERQRVAKLVDRIVTFYDQKEIWGVPCIDLMNGYDFSKTAIPERKLTDTVHMMSVSLTAFWHGYDRVIEGLHQYYSAGGKENIVYHLVGDILPEHERMVKQYGLEDHVLLCGRQSGERLQKVYQTCFLGIDMLGGHRKDYPISSSLKSREYAAYGLPVITSSPIDYLPRDYAYQLIVPYDDSPICMEDVLRFYHGIYDGVELHTLAKEIRDYAEVRCDMNVAMKPVVDWLMNG